MEHDMIDIETDDTIRSQPRCYPSANALRLTGAAADAPRRTRPRRLATGRLGHGIPARRRSRVRHTSPGHAEAVVRPVIRHRRRADTPSRIAVAIALVATFVAAWVPLAM